MDSDRDPDRLPPDSRQDEEVYTENEEGEPRMAGRADHGGEDVYRMYPDDSFRYTDPKVYLSILLVGVVLVVVPEPLTSMLGAILIFIGGALAVVDIASA